MPEYDYLVRMYDQQGAIESNKNPTFFVSMTYSKEIQDIFQIVYTIIIKNSSALKQLQI